MIKRDRIHDWSIDNHHMLRSNVKWEMTFDRVHNPWPEEAEGQYSSRLFSTDILFSHLVNRERKSTPSQPNADLSCRGSLSLINLWSSTSSTSSTLWHNSQGQLESKSCIPLGDGSDNDVCKQSISNVSNRLLNSFISVWPLSVSFIVLREPAIKKEKGKNQWNTNKLHAIYLVVRWARKIDRIFR